MPMVRSKGKANASKAREVAIRAGEEKPLPQITSQRDEDRKRRVPSADHLHQTNLDASHPERVAVRSELQRRTTDPQVNDSSPKRTLTTEENGKPQFKNGTRDAKDRQEPSTSSAKLGPPTPRKDNNSEIVTEGIKVTVREPHPDRDVIELASRESGGELRKAIVTVKAKIGNKDSEHARYLDLINDQQVIMRTQSEKLRSREAQVQELQRKLQTDQKRRQQSSSQIREQEFRTQKQEHTVRELRARLEMAEKDLRISEQRTKQLEEAWKESTEELTKLRQQSSVQKVDDNTLKAGYEEIIYSVNNWAGNYCGGRSASLKDSDLSPLESLTPHYAQYMASEVLRPVLVQAFVMKLLVDYILNFSDSDPTGLLWAGRLSPGLRLIQKALEFGDGFTTQELLLTGEIRQSQVQEYSAWKAKSAMLVAEKATQTDIDLLVADMLDHFRNELSPFVTCDNKSAPWTDLREIVQMTVRLDKEVHMSRALFTFGKWSGPDGEDFDFEFDEETCVPAHGFGPARKGMNSELIVTPFFMKTGTGDGNAYKESFYLKKCVVVCTESRRLLEKF